MDVLLEMLLICGGAQMMDGDILIAKVQIKKTFSKKKKF